MCSWLPRTALVVQHVGKQECCTGDLAPSRHCKICYDCFRKYLEYISGKPQLHLLAMLWCISCSGVKSRTDRLIYFSLVFPLWFLVFRLPPAEYQQCALIWKDVAAGLRALLCTISWHSISGLRDVFSPVLLCPCGTSPVGRNAKKLS